MNKNEYTWNLIDINKNYVSQLSKKTSISSHSSIITPDGSSLRRRRSRQR